MIKTMMTVAAGALLSAAASAGQLPLAWQAAYAGPGTEDYGSDVRVDQAGNVYVVGETQGQSTGVDFLVCKYDRHGHLLWSQRYDGEGLDDYGFLVDVDALGNVIVVGDSIGASTSYDLAVLKYDWQGNLLWARRYDGPGHDYDGTSAGRTLALDHAGNILVACTSVGAGTDYDVATLKYSPSGNLLWERRFDGPASGFDDCYSIAIDASDNVYVAADTYSLGTGSYDFAVLKYDASGSLVWVETYDGPDHGDETIYAIALDAAANVYVTGISESQQTNGDIATVTWDANGTLRWARRFDGGGEALDIGFAIAVSSQGEVVSVGEGFDDHGFETAFAIAYDSNGGQQWLQSYQDPVWLGTNVFTDVAFDAAGNVWVAGWTWAGFPQSTNGIVFKYAADGSILGERPYDGAVHGADAVFSIDLDQKGNAYLAGIVFGADFTPDCLALKCGIETTGSAMLTLR